MVGKGGVRVLTDGCGSEAVDNRLSGASPNQTSQRERESLRKAQLDAKPVEISCHSNGR